jgi:flagellar motility protein MotE (MotC chaperone)
MKEVRLLPLVIAAASALLLLKAFALGFGEGRLTGIPPAFAEEEAAVEDSSPQEGAADGIGANSREDILNRLSERRAALDAREEELDLRERLIEATRGRVEARIDELREIEARIEAAVNAREDEHAERFANLVTMYESMKARDAAAIFNDLDMPILVRVAREMNARTMAEILAAMKPEVAQRLTVELSAEPEDLLAELEERAGDDLPKIVGTRRDE